MGREQIVGKDIAGEDFLYYGDVQNGKPHGNGYWINDFSISRGSFREGFKHGLVESIRPLGIGFRSVVSYENGLTEGPHATVSGTLDYYAVGKLAGRGLTGVVRERVKDGLTEGVKIDGKLVLGTKLLDGGAGTEVWGRPDPKVSTLDLAKSWTSAKYEAGKIPLETSNQPTAGHRSANSTPSQTTSVASGAATSQACRTQYSFPFSGKRYTHPTLRSWVDQVANADLRDAVKQAKAGGYPKEVAHRLTIVQAEKLDQNVEQSIESASAVSTTTRDLRTQIAQGLPADYTCDMAASAAVCSAQIFYWQALVARQTAEGISCLW